MHHGSAGDNRDSERCPCPWQGEEQGVEPKPLWISSRGAVQGQVPLSSLPWLLTALEETAGAEPGEVQGGSQEKALPAEAQAVNRLPGNGHKAARASGTLGQCSGTGWDLRAALFRTRSGINDLMGPFQLSIFSKAAQVSQGSPSARTAL